MRGEVFVGRIVAHRQRQAIGRDRADQRRAARLHRLDRMRRVFGVAQRQRDEFVRQLGLVDDAEGILADGPDGAVMLAVDFHCSALGAVASMDWNCEKFAYHSANLGRVVRQSKTSFSRKSR